MKTKNLNGLLVLLGMVIVFSSCTEDDDPDVFLPTELQADNQWFEGEISNGEEIWLRINCDAGATAVYLEWAEKDNHGEDRNYTGDVNVSAYMLDKVTSYIEDKDNGFGDKSKSFPLSGNETQILVKVVLGDSQTEGTFAIRAKSTSTISVEYVDLEIVDVWKDSIISQDEIIGYKVKYSGEKKLKIVWAELETPEEGYTADITVSVMHADGLTPYNDVDKNKDFLDKNKSHSDDPKYILTDPDEKNLKIHIKNTTPGSFAFKVVEVTE